MTTKKIARCSIYQDRPKVCVDYPQVDHYTPRECTYSYIDGERFGDCACDVGACCNTPRVGGEPGGAAMPAQAGGSPCKHLVWEEVEIPEKDKIASASGKDEIIKEALGL